MTLLWEGSWPGKAQAARAVRNLAVSDTHKVALGKAGAVAGD